VSLCEFVSCLFSYELWPVCAYIKVVKLAVNSCVRFVQLDCQVVSCWEPRRWRISSKVQCENQQSGSTSCWSDPVVVSLLGVFEYLATFCIRN